MGDDRADMAAILKAVADAPKRDNTAYHAAMAQARAAFEAAEASLGGAVTVTTRTKTKRNGDQVVKWTFRRADPD